MKVVLAGGGTGGHVFPALAVAEALAQRGAVPHFVGASRGLEARAVPAAGYGCTLLTVEPMKGGGLRRALRGGLIAGRGVAEAAAVLRRERPRVVLGVGGYAAGPTCLAAALLQIPLAVLEPNAVPGFTNRVLSPLARRAYVAWDDAARRFRGARVVGVPVRRGFAPTPLPPGPPRVVVLGGSQGASALNTHLPAVFRALRDRGVPCEILHQTGAQRLEQAEQAYAAAGLEATVTAFVDDVPAAFARATLVVSRAGASTVAEILASARPSLLVPFPHAADDHQRANALAVQAAGAGELLPEAELARGAERLHALLSDRDRLERMATAALAHARPDAAETIADDLLALAG